MTWVRSQYAECPACKSSGTLYMLSPARHCLSNHWSFLWYNLTNPVEVRRVAICNLQNINIQQRSMFQRHNRHHQVLQTKTKTIKYHVQCSNDTTNIIKYFRPRPRPSSTTFNVPTTQPTSSSTSDQDLDIDHQVPRSMFQRHNQHHQVLQTKT